MLFLSFNNGIDVLLNAKVDHFIAIVGQNDVNKILANVMHIALHCGNQEFCFGCTFPFALLHIGLKESHRRLHGFR